MKTILLIISVFAISALLTGCTTTTDTNEGSTTQPETYVQENTKSNQESQTEQVSTDTSLKTIESELNKTDIKTEDFSDL